MSWKGLLTDLPNSDTYSHNAPKSTFHRNFPIWFIFNFLRLTNLS